MDYKALLEGGLGLSSANKVRAKLYPCARHVKVDACWHGAMNDAPNGSRNTPLQWAATARIQGGK